MLRNSVLPIWASTSESYYLTKTIIRQSRKLLSHREGNLILPTSVPVRVGRLELGNRHGLGRNSPTTLDGTRGFSMVELLIVATIVFVLSGFAIMQITRARQILVKSNVARELTMYVEKARLDSVRRHATTATQMARVTLTDASTYTMTYDTDGDGVLDNPNVINVPTGSNLTFTGPFPRTIWFNWRGRTVDSAGNANTPAAITINGYGPSTTINISAGGQSEIDVATQTDPILNSTAPAVSFRNQTQMP